MSDPLNPTPPHPPLEPEKGIEKPEEMNALADELMDLARMLDSNGSNGSEKVAGLANRIRATSEFIQKITDDLEQEKASHGETKETHRTQIEEMKGKHAEEVEKLKIAIEQALSEEEAPQ